MDARGARPKPRLRPTARSILREFIAVWRADEKFMKSLTSEKILLYSNRYKLRDKELVSEALSLVTKAYTFNSIQTIVTGFYFPFVEHTLYIMYKECWEHGKKISRLVTEIDMAVLVYEVDYQDTRGRLRSVNLLVTLAKKHKNLMDFTREKIYTFVLSHCFCIILRKGRVKSFAEILRLGCAIFLFDDMERWPSEHRWIYRQRMQKALCGIVLQWINVMRSRATHDPKEIAECFRMLVQSLPFTHTVPVNRSLTITEVDDVPDPEWMEMVSDVCRNFFPELAALRDNPRTLKHLARCCIRRCLFQRFKLPKGIAKLKIPKSLKHYLKFKE